jgi:uncharacterized cupredoxin-like copper-binding protein
MRRAFMLLLAALVSTVGITGLTVSGAFAAKAGSCATESGHDEHESDMDHGSSSKNCPTVKGARVIRVTGDRFRFVPKNIEMTAGEDVTIRLSSGDIAHDIFVKGTGHVVHAKAGKSARGGLRIDEPGTYKFWCTIPNHKTAGMTGLITVT